MPIKQNPLTEISYIRRDLDLISKNIDEIKADIKSQYVPRHELTSMRDDIGLLQRNSVTQDQFWPVKILVLGFVALVLVSVVGAILTVVITRP